MTNKEIAKTFQFLGNIMELHGENKFKIRSYQNAYITLRKLDQPLADMSDEEMEGIKGVGKAISGKIRELLDKGTMATLEGYKEQTPDGIQEMLNIKGFGPKKILSVWKELGVESVGELLYAVNENRLIELKGFGKKTQDDLKQKLEYYQKSKHKYHYAALEAEATVLLEKLRQEAPDEQVEWTGALRRRANIQDQMELLATGSVAFWQPILEKSGNVISSSSESAIKGTTEQETPFELMVCEQRNFGNTHFKTTAAPDFWQAFSESYPEVKNLEKAEESAVFEHFQLPDIAPELREQSWALNLAQQNQLPELLEVQDIRGVVHSHSTYSDGLNSLREMAEYSKAQGYDYLGITDHSKSAFYANGLQPERVLQQMEEIDALNKELAPFRIFKGIESDILNDGSLDYEEDILQRFDFIIASVHSNLRMDEEKATQRLVRAIENPYTSMLGHPTGRLLLSRQGYPIDHKMVIDACAANGVAIELNANPYRLDLDWSWIPYALEKNVWISINPDAHSTQGIHDIHFGVLSARKGGLSKAFCLNAMDAEGFEKWCRSIR